MKRELKARLERLAPIPVVDRVRSGSPANLVLRPKASLSRVRTIDATAALSRRGLPVLKAKRAIELMVERGEARIRVPIVENVDTLASELASAGVSTEQIAVASADPRQIREQLGLTQEQFALRYGLDIDTVQNWEQGRTSPDKTGIALLRAIACLPDEISAAQEGDASIWALQRAQALREGFGEKQGAKCPYVRGTLHWYDWMRGFHSPEKGAGERGFPLESDDQEAALLALVSEVRIQPSRWNVLLPFEQVLVATFMSAIDVANRSLWLRRCGCCSVEQAREQLAQTWCDVVDWMARQTEPV